jgi:uncharacterized protein
MPATERDPGAGNGRAMLPVVTTTALAGFHRELRSRGVPVNTARFHAYLDALAALDVSQRDHVYWAGVYTLCSSPAHLGPYDEAFRSWFESRAAQEVQLSAASEDEQFSVMFQPSEDEGSSDEHELDIPTLASEIELLRRRDFAQLTDEEREEIGWLLARLDWDPETRRTRRRVAARRGRLDRRRTIRAALRGAGEITALRRSRRRDRHRRVVLLVDVSGSMRDYAVAFLRFAHVAMRQHDVPTEVFALGTRLTRITQQLDLPDPDSAMRRVAEVIEDWQGGTRLGAGIKAFLDGWGQRGTARGAVVVILSDGWERDDPALLGRQMERLARLAYRVLWANPRKSRDGYEPLVSGMASSLPYVDHFIDGSNIEALEELSKLISRGGRRPLGSRTARYR